MQASILKIGSSGLLFTFIGVLFAPIYLLPAPSHALPATTFECILQGKKYVTVARRGTRTTAPMIEWKDTSFGEKYPPQARCKIVSQRLTKAVSSTGKLNSLDMTHGIVGSTPVICYVTSKSNTCNSENILFSLKESERGQEQTIISQLLEFSKTATTKPLVRGGSTVTNPNPAVEKKIVTWGDAIERGLDLQESGAAADPNSSGE
jgi:Circadian oscillating protein COP23